MKKLICMFITTGMCLCFAIGFANSKDEAISTTAKEEKASQQVEQEMSPAEGYSSPERQRVELTKLAGEITAIERESGEITVEDGSGNGVVLTAGKTADLKEFNVGDEVVLEYNSDKLITSLNKQGAK